MYSAYFGFSESPFENNLDQRFFYLSEGHKEVLAALLYFVREGKGFALVCGDVGTGKTMLINSLLDRLPPTVTAILISNADVSYASLLRYIAAKLRIPTGQGTSLELFDEVKETLTEARKRGRRLLLIIDEAHLLTNEALEGIRVLSNMETRREKLLQILLVGQYELSHKLDRFDMRQLRERININRFLSPMDPWESIEYVDHRLNRVGGSFDACFEPECARLIHKMTEGVPRRINLLCDHALLICQAEQVPKVTRETLKQAQEALRSDRVWAPRDRVDRKGRADRLLRGVLKAFAGFAVLALVATLAYRAAPDARIQRIIARIVPPQTAALAPDEAASSASPAPRPAAPKPAFDPAASGRESRGFDVAPSPPADPAPSRPKSAPVSHPAAEQQDRLRATDGAGSATPLVVRPPEIVERDAVDVRPPATESDGFTPVPPLSGDKRPAEKASGSDNRQASPVRADTPAPSPSSFPQHRFPAHDAVTAFTADGSAPQTLADPRTLETPPPDGPSDPPEPGPENRQVPSGLSDFEPEPPLISPPPQASDLISRNVEMQNVRKVRRGDTLMRIATELAPEDARATLQAILRLNPEITDMDRIYEGQVLRLPSPGASKRGAASADHGPHYAVYGTYQSLQALEPVMNRLARKGVRYLVVNAPSASGAFIHEVIVGGYETSRDLRRALDGLND